MRSIIVFFKYFAFLKMSKLADSDSVIQLRSIVAKWRYADKTFIVGVYCLCFEKPELMQN